MSGTSEYDPDPSAVPSDPLYTALLSQRDVGLRVPINFVSTPGVALTPACFSNNVFEDGPAQKCLSNLLATGYRRFIVDLYWDTSRLSWSLCPVELATAGATATPSGSRNATSTLTTLSQSTSGSATLATGTLSSAAKAKRENILSGLSTDALEVYPRQTASALVTVSGGSLSVSISTGSLSSSANSIATVSSSNGGSSPTSSPSSEGTRHQIGPYTCDTTLGLTNLTNVIAEHLRQTENSLNATLKYLVFNLHAAAPFDNPTGTPPTPQGSLLPDTGNYIGELINSSLSSYIYTPAALSTQRADLNTSWYTVTYDYRPLDSYLNVESMSDGIIYTDDGWPSESFIELQHALRVVAAIGTIEPQMQDYNYTADEDTIFPPGYIANQIAVSLSATGEVISGCFFQQNVTSFSAINSSWAISSSSLEASSLSAVDQTVSNLTTCGISPILNSTLESSANENATLYIDYIRRGVWAWAYAEPRDSSASSQNFHCAALNISNGGKWQVENCANRHYGACRIEDAPYRWTLTGQSSSYGKIDRACDDGNVFSVPRTALENTYLSSAIQLWTETNDYDDSSDLVWVNFNDLDVAGCWVDGANSTCPYKGTRADPTRRVVVPVVAAVIVIVLAIATIFIKCAGNRQSARTRKRRGDDGWDYEGVPS